MATLGSPSPPGSPSLRGRRRPWARKCERYCCSVLSCFPLAFVYGLTSWAVWVEARIGFLPDEVPKVTWTGYTTSTLGIVLYLLLNWSYSVAVFTDPGSPLNTKDGYSHIPMEEGEQPYTSFTVKSTGDLRYCKKCQVKKPDRSHHCSTCRRCVLKMDHHCPWLATCVGLRNYKPFLLFLIYTSVFCWLSFAVSITWVWSEITNDEQLVQVLMPINFILLAVLSGIIGLVLTGFTLWHVYLAATGQTTIESLEKTRYLSPIRKSLQNHINGARNYVNGVPSPSYGQQLAEIHANALPGITRPEEGDATSPATASLRNNYNELQLARERDRYQDYLDEQASEKLPNAFDLGWRRNLMHVFGERRLLWLLPLCNTTGDGWTWEASKKWLSARERIAKERSHHESRSSQPDELDERAGFVNGSPGQHVRRGARRSRSSGQRRGMTDPARSGSPREIRAVDGWDGRAHGPPNELSNWNDIPEDMLNSRRGK